jgi:hypothetical protein
LDKIFRNFTSKDILWEPLLFWRYSGLLVIKFELLLISVHCLCDEILRNMFMLEIPIAIAARKSRVFLLNFDNLTYFQTAEKARSLMQFRRFRHRAFFLVQIDQYVS